MEKMKEEQKLHREVRKIMKNKQSFAAQKNEIEELKKLFPTVEGITCSRKEEQEDEDARQIISLRWYPPGKNPYDLDTECFDGLLGERNGKLAFKPKLNAQWLRDRFTEKYLASVRSMWDEDKKRKAGTIIPSLCGYKYL